MENLLSAFMLLWLVVVVLGALHALCKAWLGLDLLRAIGLAALIARLWS